MWTLLLPTYQREAHRCLNPLYLHLLIHQQPHPPKPSPAPSDCEIYFICFSSRGGIFECQGTLSRAKNDDKTFNTTETKTTRSDRWTSAAHWRSSRCGIWVRINRGFHPIHSAWASLDQLHSLACHIPRTKTTTQAWASLDKVYLLACQITSHFKNKLGCFFK